MTDSRLAAGALALLFGGAALSQIKLQTWERRKTLELRDSSNRFILKRPDYARRGSILTSDGSPLARDIDTFELTLNFKNVPKSEAFFVELSAATGVPATEFQAQAARSNATSATWRRLLSPTQAKDLQELRQTWRADGLSLRRIQRRGYPLGQDASCLVGWVKEDSPQLGIEKALDGDLRGVDGSVTGPVDKRGEFLATRPLEEVAKRDGSDVTLTIDKELQTMTAAAVRRAVEDNHAEDGVGLVYDPKTGDILAMANWPSFAPLGPDGLNADMSRNSGFNPNIMARLEPGSTFKVLTLAKALDMGRTSMTQSVMCTGELHPSGSTRIRCDEHHGNRAHGLLTPEDAIARSCNVAAATWALSVDRGPMFDYIKDLGLRDKPKIGLPGEMAGYLRDNEPAQRLQLATIGFGQSINCTPVTLVSAFGMLGNGGVRVQPRLIKRVGFKETILDKGTQVIKKSSADEVMRCMEAVIEKDRGTGKSLRIPGYRLAGKTGTAQIIGRGEKGFCANFVGFVPAENPRAVILVMVNRPKDKYYGAEVAGPAFQQIARSVIRRYNIPPSIVENPTASKEGTPVAVTLSSTLNSAPTKPAVTKKPRISDREMLEFMDLQPVAPRTRVKKTIDPDLEPDTAEVPSSSSDVAVREPRTTARSIRAKVQTDKNAKKKSPKKPKAMTVVRSSELVAPMPVSRTINPKSKKTKVKVEAPRASSKKSKKRTQSPEE